MRSFAAIFTALLLPLYVFAAHFGNRGDRHLDLAVRARGDVLQKRAFSGPFTVYDITTGVTACGGRYSPDAYVVALNQGQFGNGQGTSQYCEASITITYNGITVSATVVDECPGCGANGLDMTYGLFKKLTGASTGVFHGSWSFGSGSAPKEGPTTTTPKYTPPKTSSTSHYKSPSPTPSSTTSSSSPSPSRSSSSTSTSASTNRKTFSLASAKSTTPIMSHSLSPSNPATTPTPTSSALPSESGFAQPVGTVNDGQTEGLETLYQIIIGFGNIVQAAQT